MKTSSPTQQEIADEAYQIYVRNGCQHGHALDHWLEAEAALRPRQPAAKPAAPQASSGKSQAAAAAPAPAAKGRAASKKPAKSAK